MRYKLPNSSPKVTRKREIEAQFIVDEVSTPEREREREREEIGPQFIAGEVTRERERGEIGARFVADEVTERRDWARFVIDEVMREEGERLKLDSSSMRPCERGEPSAWSSIRRQQRGERQREEDLQLSNRR